MESSNERRVELGQAESIALLYIQVSGSSMIALRCAAQRLRANIRVDDVVFLCEGLCLYLIVLPGTPLEGAYAVARRVSTLLVDVEPRFQVLQGESASTTLRQLQEQHQIVCIEQEYGEKLTLLHSIDDEQTCADPSLPYLAFLARYPSRHLLHTFPYELACRYRCVPVGAERGVITLATSRRLHHDVVVLLHQATQRAIFQVRCEARMIDDVLHYWQRTAFA
ncbi:MAG TPA: hypothetical protein VL461_00115 [Dictyobacter sp.]|nr:hypothetical protein [Dictyobacter sp.]